MTVFKMLFSIFVLICLSLFIGSFGNKYRKQKEREATIKKYIVIAIPKDQRENTGYDSISLVVWGGTIKAYFACPNEYLLKK